MTTWLYQIGSKLWSPERFRLEVWEGERWLWSVTRIVNAQSPPQPGDTLFFFYAPGEGAEPGFYGWAVVLGWNPDSPTQLAFRPTAPSDRLKMDPWWEGDRGTPAQLAHRIRGRVRKGTLYAVPPEVAGPLRRGLAAWLHAPPAADGGAR